MSKKWRNVPLSEICDINPRMGKTTFAEDSSYAFVPMASVGAADGSINVSTKRPYAEVKKGFTSFQSGDVLFAKITPCMENGKMAVVPDLENHYGFGSTEFHVIRPNAGIDPKYVYYFVSCSDFRREAGHNMTGAVGQKRVPTDFIKQSLIPLPPTPEDQQQIVAEIEKQFSRLDEAVASLKRIQANLKRYKAAVLKAAVEGKLTEQWRMDHPDVESADQLLKRILTERRAKWEESVGAKQGVSASPGFSDVGNNVGDCNKGEAGESLASPLPKMKAKGIKPKDDSWKKKYKEPVGPDTGNLPELPEGWVWATLEQLLCFLRNGISAKPDAESGLPILRISAVRPMLVKIHDVRFLSSNEKEYVDYVLLSGDLLFTRYNGNPDLVGVCGVVPELSSKIVHPDKIIRCKLASTLTAPKYVANMANIGVSRSYLAQRVRTTAGQAGISGTDLRGMPIPLSSHKEQQIVLEEIDRRLSVTEELETTIETNLKRAERLRQTILQKAFSGGLVS